MQPCWHTLVGEVRAVKVLGVLCMIDDGEADWKVVVIDAADPWGESTAAVAATERSQPTLSRL